MVGKPGGKTPLRRPTIRWDDNTDNKYAGCDGMEWIDLAQHKHKWWAVAKAAMNFRVP